MGEIRDNLKRNLGYYLSYSGMSQKQLAERLNVSQSAVTNWIKGKNSPDIELVAQMCEIFQVDITELMGAKKTPDSEESGDDKVSMEALSQGLMQLFINTGYIDQSSDISDSDLEFLKALFLLVKVHFGNRGKPKE